MAQRELIWSTERYTAEGAVTQFAVLVAGTSNKQVKLPTAADVGNIIGVAMADAASGAEVPVAEPGSVVRCIAQAAIARGAFVSIQGVTGKVKTAAPGAGTNTFLVGQALNSAAADGDHVWVRIDPGVMQG